MNKEVAKKLIEILRRKDALKFISLWGGVVQTLETTEAGSTEDKKIIRRIPISDYFITERCGEKPQYMPMVQDSSESGIIYFEDNGSVQETSVNISGKLTAWRCNLDLVCWLNRKKIANEYTEFVNQRVITEIVKQLSFRRKNEDCFIGMQVSVNSIKPQTASIFGKYSYDEKVNQYLLAPYEYFSISLEIKFFINPECLQKLTLNENQLC